MCPTFSFVYISRYLAECTYYFYNEKTIQFQKNERVGGAVARVGEVEEIMDNLQ